jgi:hypothetical protein
MMKRQLVLHEDETDNVQDSCNYLHPLKIYFDLHIHHKATVVDLFFFF